MEKKFKKIEHPWNPQNKGDEITGVLLKVEEEIGENKSMFYTLETDDLIQAVWGSVVLDAKMKFVEVGDEVKIVFQGKKSGQKKEDYKDYEVSVRRKNKN